MGKIIVDAIATEVDVENQKLVAKSQTSLVVGHIDTPEKKSINAKEDEVAKKLAVMENNIKNMEPTNDQSIDFELNDDTQEKEEMIEDAEEKTIEDDGNEMII